MTRQKFNRWTIIGPTQGGYALCQCDCGRQKPVYVQSVTAGRSKSCGCGERKPKSSKYAGAHIPTFRSWQAMRQRCSKTYRHQGAWHRYAGRGIEVCSRWDSSFFLFVEDMGLRPSGCSLDRIDIDGNYEPGNCRWATVSEQARNTSANRFLVIEGERKTLSDWAHLSGIGVSTIRERLRRGWPPEQAISVPAMRKGTQFLSPARARRAGRTADQAISDADV